MTRTPIIHTISRLNFAINIVVMGGFAFVGRLVAQLGGIPIGLFIYLVIAYLLQQTICHDHRQAIRYCKRQQFELAIPAFQRSLQFFRDHEWIDKFRAITLFSASGLCYREMAMISLAFCYAQVGDGKNARSTYEACLEEFPGNGIAESALKLLNAGRDS